MWKIDIRNGAIGREQMIKDVAKVPARQLLREKSAGAIAEIGTSETQGVGVSKHFKYQKEALDNARKYKKDYERTLPETLNPDVKNQMWKRAKQLKDEFIVGMLSRDELHPVKQFTENGTIKCVTNEEAIRMNRCVERESAWQRVNNPKIDEFKRIMRHLNPDDPNAGDVEKYRPRRPNV